MQTDPNLTIIGNGNHNNRWSEEVTIHLDMDYDATAPNLFTKQEWKAEKKEFSGDKHREHIGKTDFIGDGEYSDLVDGRSIDVNDRTNDVQRLLDALYLGDGIAGVTASIVQGNDGRHSVRLAVETKDAKAKHLREIQAQPTAEGYETTGVMTLTSGKTKTVTVNSDDKVIDFINLSGSFADSYLKAHGLAPAAVDPADSESDRADPLPLTEGTSGNDTLEADDDNGSDFVRGRAGDDCINGLGGDDRLDGDRDDDTLDGGRGNDILFGDHGDDVLYGHAGNDWLFGDSSDEAGRFGDDVLRGGSGLNVIETGNGQDTVQVNLSNEFEDVVVDFTVGTDTLQFANLDMLGGAKEAGGLGKGHAVALETKIGQLLGLDAQGVNQWLKAVSSADEILTLVEALEQDTTGITDAYVVGGTDLVLDFGGLRHVNLMGVVSEDGSTGLKLQDLRDRKVDERAFYGKLGNNGEGDVSKQESRDKSQLVTFQDEEWRSLMFDEFVNAVRDTGEDGLRQDLRDTDGSIVAHFEKKLKDLASVAYFNEEVPEGGNLFDGPVETGVTYRTYPTTGDFTNPNGTFGDAKPKCDGSEPPEGDETPDTSTPVAEDNDDANDADGSTPDDPQEPHPDADDEDTMVPADDVADDDKTGSADQPNEEQSRTNRDGPNDPGSGDSGSENRDGVVVGDNVSGVGVDSGEAGDNPSGPTQIGNNANADADPEADMLFIKLGYGNSLVGGSGELSFFHENERDGRDRLSRELYDDGVMVGDGIWGASGSGAFGDMSSGASTPYFEPDDRSMRWNEVQFIGTDASGPINNESDVLMGEIWGYRDDDWCGVC